jgi:hypothetical protein
VDQALLKTLRFFATLALFEHNRRNDDALRIETMTQDNVEISYLTGSKLLPPGLQPAMALKGGYLLLASTPDAIRRFRATGGPVSTPGEVPLLRLNVPELARALKGLRQEFRGVFADISAEQALDNVLSTLALFEGLEVTQRTEAGQVLLTMRLRVTK